MSSGAEVVVCFLLGFQGSLVVDKTSLLDTSVRCAVLGAHIEQIQGVRVSVDANEIANAAYQVWLLHTSFADIIAVICQEWCFLVVGCVASVCRCMSGKLIDPQMF